MAIECRSPDHIHFAGPDKTLDRGQTSSCRASEMPRMYPRRYLYFTQAIRVARRRGPSGYRTLATRLRAWRSQYVAYTAPSCSMQLRSRASTRQGRRTRSASRLPSDWLKDDKGRPPCRRMGFCLRPRVSTIHTTNQPFTIGREGRPEAWISPSGAGS